jgi:flagellar motor switch protein FliN/FliY
MTQQMAQNDPRQATPPDRQNSPPPPEAAGLAAQDRAQPRSALDSAAFDRLGGLEVTATVELGSARLLLREVAGLAPGAAVRLDRLVGEPVDLTVNGRLFGRGDVVVVGDHLGLRLTELAGDRPLGGS